MAICPRTDIFSYFFLTRKINRLYLLTSRPIVVFSRSLNPKTSQKMKTLIHRLGYSLVLLIVVVSCSQPESEEPVIDTSLEVVEVSGEYMDGLMTAYKTFVENLSAEEKAQLASYVDSQTQRGTTSYARTSNDAECRCLSTQASCSAEGIYGDCCLCWDPKTQAGACGVYLGIATCRLEERPVKTPEKETPSPKSPNIRIYPKQIGGLVDYIETNRLGRSSSLSKSGLADFKKLIGSL